MPRTPAVYEKKMKWRLESQADPECHLWKPATVGSTNSNYRSAKELAQAVEREHEASVDKGLAIVMSEEEARARYGDELVIASLGAQVKDSTGREIVVRLLFHGTHGILVNGRIRVRDQDWTPAAPDIKRILREIDAAGQPAFALKIDVVPIAEEDWDLLGCRSGEGKPVYINTTGTFGVASAGYWWGRLAGAMVRACHYFAGHELAMWLPIVADDLLAIAVGPHFRRALMLVLALLVASGLL